MSHPLERNQGIAFIGAGKMASSIFGGLIEDGWPKNKIWATARNKTPGLTMGTLSMGMSGDLEAAVEEGSTMVRIGTALFGTRT